MINENRGGEPRGSSVGHLGVRHPPCFMWQFLYFLPLPHGHGSFRPTFAPTLRIVSTFFGSPPAFVLCSVAASAARVVSADCACWCIARAPAHIAISTCSSATSSTRNTL